MREVASFELLIGNTKGQLTPNRSIERTENVRY